MLIDDFLPKYDFIETHDIQIRASAETVFGLMNEVDLCELPIIHRLFFLRGLRGGHLQLRDLKNSGFEILGIEKNKELLLGLAGKFQTLTGQMQKITAENFRAFDKKGFAKAVRNFSVDKSGNETRLTTETRVRCLDDASRRSFRFYRTFIQPFSGLIRNEMLRVIKRKAEAV